MERAVGWFVFLATALLLFGFGYYLYHVADSKGWFVIKAKFHTYVQSSAGLNVGDPVYLMGFSVGQITSVHPMQPRDPNNVRLEFEIRDPYFRYIWTDGSFVKINAAGFLNQRQLEVTRGTNGYARVVTQPITIFTNLDDLKQLVAAQTNEWQLSQEVFDKNSNLLFHAYATLDTTNLQQIEALKPASIYAYNNQQKDKHSIVASWDGRIHRYKIFTPNDDTAWLRAEESPPVSDELQAMVAQVKSALPSILALTNQLATVLNNSAQVTSNLNIAVIDTHPVLTNANALIENLDTNVTAMLINLSDITSNLAAQVQSNSNMLSGISKTVVDYDNFVQGLKHHWLLRSAFKKENKTNSPAKKN